MKCRCSAVAAGSGSAALHYIQDRWHGGRSTGKSECRHGLCHTADVTFSLCCRPSDDSRNGGNRFSVHRMPLMPWARGCSPNISRSANLRGELLAGRACLSKQAGRVARHCSSPTRGRTSRTDFGRVHGARVSPGDDCQGGPWRACHSKGICRLLRGSARVRTHSLSRCAEGPRHSRGAHGSGQL